MHVLFVRTRRKVLAEELVPGDLVLIEEGDRISVMVVYFATDLQVNQSA